MSSPKPPAPNIPTVQPISNTNLGDFTRPPLPKRARISTDGSSADRNGAGNSSSQLLSRFSHAGEHGGTGIKMQGAASEEEDGDLQLQAMLANRREQTLSIYGPDIQCLPCLCRVASEKVTEEMPETCQAQDHVNTSYVDCMAPISNNNLVRAHIRDHLKALCDNHLYRLRMHYCCPGCGVFCLQGQFNKCREADQPHYFHLACVTELGQCPHCLGKNYEPAIVDLTLLPMAGAELPSNRARMTPYTLSDGVRRHLNMPIDTIIRRHTHRLPGTDKEICTADLADVKDREIIRKAIVSIDLNVVASVENLEEAMAQGDLRMVLSYLAKKMDINTKLTNDMTLLQYAASKGLPYICYVLIALGANVEAEDSDGRTPIMLAASGGHYCICNMLMRFGKADILHKDKTLDTTLHLAAKVGAVEIVRLLYYGSNRMTTVDEQDTGGWTPLMWAAENGHVETVYVLMHSRARLDIMDNEGNIALHWAAMSGSVDVGSQLLQFKNDEYVNKQNALGYTPLMIACREKHLSFMQLLIANGADPRIEDGDHKTAEVYLRMHLENDDDPKLLMLQLAEKTIPIREFWSSRKRGIINNDLSHGKERMRIVVINDEDDANVDGLIYVTGLVETSDDTRVDRHIVPEVCTCKCPVDCSLPPPVGEDGCLCIQDSRIWYDEHGRLVDNFPFGTPDQPRYIFECNHLCRCSAACKNRLVQRGMTVCLKLIRTSDRGWGVFADEDIPKGSFICEYAGELIPDDEADARNEDTYLFELSDAHYPTTNPGDKNFCVDANKFGNVSRYINHGCDANLIPIKVFYDHYDVKAPHVAFFTTKPISKNEELTFDYGPKFWWIKGQQFSCKCRSPKCRYGPDKIKGFLQSYVRQFKNGAQ